MTKNSVNSNNGYNLNASFGNPFANNQYNTNNNLNNYNSQNGTYDFTNSVNTTCDQSSYSNTVYKKSDITNNNLPGGYSNSNVLPNEVIHFLKNIYNNSETALLSIYNIQQQIVAGKNYKMMVSLLYKPSCLVIYYDITLQQQLNGDVMLTSSILLTY